MRAWQASPFLLLPALALSLPRCGQDSGGSGSKNEGGDGGSADNGGNGDDGGNAGSTTGGSASGRGGVGTEGGAGGRGGASGRAGDGNNGGDAGSSGNAGEGGESANRGSGGAGSGGAGSGGAASAGSGGKASDPCESTTTCANSDDCCPMSCTPLDDNDCIGPTYDVEVWADNTNSTYIRPTMLEAPYNSYARIRWHNIGAYELWIVNFGSGMTWSQLAILAPGAYSTPSSTAEGPWCGFDFGGTYQIGALNYPTDERAVMALQCVR